MVLVATESRNNYKHRTPIHSDVVDAIRPLYESLTEKKIAEMRRLKNVIWRIATRVHHSGAAIVKIAENIEACIFNEGAKTLMMIMQQLNIDAGRNCAAYCENQDRARIDLAEVRAQRHEKRESLAGQGSQLLLKLQLPQRFKQESVPNSVKKSLSSNSGHFVFAPGNNGCRTWTLKHCCGDEWRRLDGNVIRNEVVLGRIGEERSVLRGIEKRRAKWTTIWKNILQKLIIEGKLEGKKVIGRRNAYGHQRKEFRRDKEREAQDRTLWRQYYR
ncbi:hypothetical protein J437_LFUL014332 [Ladona fulva]|uniref:Uncharacterized protein n=1 Tax=Ladona fulva TaxID=123851 RepID=A0A8K0KGZ3_LADFU|nr:hypothetical protein J437_LFUL014332 [Ladona fulva]